MLKNKKFYISLSLSVSILLGLCTSIRAAEIDREIENINKTWDIKFNEEIEFNDETKKDIIVKDESGNILDTEISLKDGKTIMVSAPKEAYKVGKIYTLNIGTKIRSKNFKFMKSPAKFIFKIKDISSNTNDYKYKNLVNNTINMTISTIEKKGIETEWEAIGLSKAGKTIPNSYVNKIAVELKQSKGILDQPTDYERMVLGLLAAGKDPMNFEGYNLIEKIYNNEDIEGQGINAEIFGLIALDSKAYDVPSTAIWTREKLIEAILDNRTKDKGWDFAGVKADPDMTGMALIALAPHKDKPEVKQAIDEAVAKLVSLQKESGAFASYGVENCESVCQVIMGLCANGIDPIDSKFVKNGKTMIDVLMTFKTADGGFSHIRNGRKDIKATEQAVQALEAYKSLKEKH